MYEVVWLRMFARVLGVTSYATAMVLSAFMAGLALGSYLFGKWADRKSVDPLKIYAAVELIIGVFALTLPLILGAFTPSYKWLYQASAGSMVPVMVAKVAVLFVCLLVPTTLMGGTLPLLTVRLCRGRDDFGRGLSSLYAFNTLGAVMGVLVSGFLLIGLVGESATVYVAVLINFVVALLAFRLASVKEPMDVARETTPEVERRDDATPSTATDSETFGMGRFFLIMMFVNGFTALAYEVIWTRHLILFLRTSIYAFSGMLAVFLGGIAFGGYVIRNYADEKASSLFWPCEILISVVSVANVFLFYFLGLPQNMTVLGSYTPVAWTFVILFPLATLFGMVLPLAARWYSSKRSLGRDVGSLYACNTMGNIFGAAVAGFLLIPCFGSANSIVILAALNAAVAGVAAWRVVNKRRWVVVMAVVMAMTFCAAFFLVSRHNPFLKLIEAKIAHMTRGDYSIYANKEGVEGTVTAFMLGDEERSPPIKGLWLNGVGMTFLGDETKLMAHLPLMFVPDANKMLVVCFGMGTTVKSASLYPELNVDSIELVKEVVDCFPFYHKEAGDIAKNPRVNMMVGDGRNYLLLNDTKYDVITIDPPPPIHSAGTVNLYSREFLEMCRGSLTDQGVMCMWIPKCAAEELLSLVATFVSVFPNTHAWSGPSFWGFYLIGLPEGKRLDPTYAETAFQRHPFIQRDMGEYTRRWTNPVAIENLHMWSPEELKDLARNGVVVTDDFPYTEFPMFRDMRTVTPGRQIQVRRRFETSE